MLWWFQVNSEGTQPDVSMYPSSPKLSSHSGCHVTLSRFPVLYSRFLLTIHLKYSSVYKSVSNFGTILSLHPSSWQPITLFSMSVSRTLALSLIYPFLFSIFGSLFFFLKFLFITFLFCFEQLMVASILFLCSLPSLISNCLSLLFGTQGGSRKHKPFSTNKK